MKSKIILIGFFLLSIFSCEDSENLANIENRYIIASKQVDCVGVGSQKCFLVKKKSNG